MLRLLVPNECDPLVNEIASQSVPDSAPIEQLGSAEQDNLTSAPQVRILPMAPLTLVGEIHFLPGRRLSILRSSIFRASLPTFDGQTHVAKIDMNKRVKVHLNNCLTSRYIDPKSNGVATDQAVWHRAVRIKETVVAKIRHATAEVVTTSTMVGLISFLIVRIGR
ncbi:uncharacterized protein BO95DRAFT_262675 [Aspergillus brunneoviolaceus CBS 621.78]|uniref:Uncharacterized protein n=1 Tax=Aspergillus brunneoviolaceus CBS 621.78 TaxID=1450534 RepID=A0ACD1FX31_9EURO|nr:hypothetical protein BO95DRAFT_262675 [Aspergillus brunneoviolaceus CBS 621.78]RAH41529.1 hypothetical protein BO95DRAFT_262675 [Aspergillus brunneoviolaceus CBS 621.78]